MNTQGSKDGEDPTSLVMDKNEIPKIRKLDDF